MARLDGFRVLRSESSGETVENRTDDGSVALNGEIPGRACKSCFSGCWRMIAGGVRDVRNYFSHIGLCREVGDSGAGNDRYQEVVSVRSRSPVLQGDGNGLHRTEQNNSYLAKDKLELILKLSPLFSENDQETINSLSSKISTAKANSLKEDSDSTIDIATNPHDASEVEALKITLEQILGRISKDCDDTGLLIDVRVGSSTAADRVSGLPEEVAPLTGGNDDSKNKSAGKGIKNILPATVKTLSINLDSFNCKELTALCETINIPGNLIRLFNSKLLKEKMIEYIKNSESGLFRIPGRKADISQLSDSFENKLLIKIQNDNGLPILNDFKVVSSYVKEQFRAMNLTGTEKELLENKLKALENPVDQVLYVDILNILYYQCEASKKLTDKQAGSNKMLSFSNFVKAVGPSICAGRDLVSEIRNVPTVPTVPTDEAVKFQKEQTGRLEVIWRKDLETFMEVWPKVREGWEGSQGRSQ